MRRIALADHPEWAPDWPSHIAWSNLAKGAPWEGGNPASAVLAAQRGHAGTSLLARELTELRPRRVVALTGSWWFSPFADALDLPLEPRTGLVEAVGRRDGTSFVVAVHPMTRSPGAVADAVVSALAEVDGQER